MAFAWLMANLDTIMRQTDHPGTANPMPHILQRKLKTFFCSFQLALAVHSAIENNTLMMETFTGKPVFRYVVLNK